MALETVHVDMDYLSNSKCLSLLCSEPNGERTFRHKEIYFNECGLLRNVNSRSQQSSAINNTETVCIVYTIHP